MPQQGQRRDERGNTVMILPDNLQQFRFFSRREFFLEIPHHMLQHVAVLFGGGVLGEPLHEQLFVAFQQSGERQLLPLGYQGTHGAIGCRGVGHHQQLLAGMEFHQLSRRGSGCQKQLPAAIAEDTLNEIFPKIGIVEAPLLFHG